MATRRKKVKKHQLPGTFDYERSRRYAAALSPAARTERIKNIVSNMTRGHEVTEAAAFARAEQSGYEHHDIETAISELVDDGKIRSTVIDGKEFGFLPGLVGVKK